jgi:hypothetical protein
VGCITDSGEEVPGEREPVIKKMMMVITIIIIIFITPGFLEQVDNYIGWL